MIVLTLPYPVSANRYWQTVYVGKGAQKRAIMVPTKEAKAYRDEVAWRAKSHGLSAPLAGRLVLTVGLYPERPQDWARRAAKDPAGWDDTVRCIDLGNCEKVLSDALNGVVWEDDKQLRRIVLDRHEPDAHGARVVVTIAPHHLVGMAPQLFGEVAA